MKINQSNWARLALYVGVLVAVCVIIVFALGTDRIVSFFAGKDKEEAAVKDEPPPAYELVRTSSGAPVEPPTLRLTQTAAQKMGIAKETIKDVVPPSPDRPRSLPPQMGTLAFDNDRLFNVRSRFPGTVNEIMDCPLDQRGSVPRLPRKPGAGPVVPPFPTAADRSRQFTVGDRVKKGDLLAIVWSKDLGDKKGNLIDATIDLRRDSARLKDYEKLYKDGVIAKNVLFEQDRIVKKDRSAQIAAERTLRTWKLDEEEIAAVKLEAETIDEEKRDPRKEMDWARSEVRAMHDGILVEKNTHLDDWVDPSNSTTPMFRIADLDKLHVWISPAEEYLPILQDFLFKPEATPLSWDIYLQANPKAPPMTGALLRIAPSINYNDHLPLLVGVVDNPDGKLLVGQFVTVTVKVAVDKSLLELPTSAVNEEKDRSVVFVQRDAGKLDFTLLPINIVHRFKDVVYVRMASPGENGDASLRPGDRVLTESVVELTKAMRDLLAKDKLARQNKN